MSELKKFIVEMLREDATDSRRVSAIGQDLLDRMLSATDLAKPQHLMRAAAFATAHDGLVRSGELMSGIKMKQLTWMMSTHCRLRVRTKTEQIGAGATIDMADTKSQFSAVKMLKAWCRANKLEGNPEAFLFPRWSARDGFFDWTKPASADWLRKEVKSLVAQVGEDPTSFSGHSFRAGGATDLFKTRTPYWIIKKAGRWKSDAALLYYRSEDDVTSAVAEAFSKLAL
jgi:hypothetical protein